MRITAKRRESATIASLQLFPADGTPVASAVPGGQYLTVRLSPAPTTAAVLRNYSLSNLPSTEDGYRISVKREPAGTASGYLHDHVQVGDVLEVAAPRGSFVVRDGSRPVVLVSAGVGATPVLAMLHGLAAAQDPRPVWWVHGARSDLEDAFRNEVADLLQRLPDAHRLTAYSQPRPGAPNGTDADIHGRVGLAALEQAGVPMNADFYLCGPPGFLRELTGALAARGVPAAQVVTEVFGSLGAYLPGIVGTGSRPAPHPPEGSPGVGPTVSFVRSGLSVSWDLKFASLLDLAEACDVPVGFGCRNGTCHSCESSVLAGAIDYLTEPLEPPPTGRVLVCCSQPRSDLVLDL
jgi:ferredoxin-NADP reductase